MIRVGILNDELASHGVELEREEIMGELNGAYAGSLADATLVWAGSGLSELESAPALDLLVVDYGALDEASIFAPARYTAVVRRFADDHPGVLVVLWTGYTAAVYSEIFAAEFGSIDHLFEDRRSEGICRCGRPEPGHVSTEPLYGNVLFRYAPSHFGGYRHGREYDSFWARLRTWFGLPPEPEPEDLPPLTSPY